MLFLLAAIFLSALAAPLLARFLPRLLVPLLAAVPMAGFYWLALQAPIILAAQPIAESYTYLPQLGVRFSFWLDGLSLLFGFMVLGVGALVVVYAGGYLADEPDILRGRFFAYLQLFMGAMLGVVLADNIFSLFIFWELTSLSSFLLIAFSGTPLARRHALQALLITGAGGMALLIGLLLLSHMGSSTELSVLRAVDIRGQPFYLLCLVFVALGAFTKSAQLPFHFWLPNAMSAPTPVSAYLHSAAMVKAGIYLLARLQSNLGETLPWLVILVMFGSFTALWASWRAFWASDMKKLLAYTTVSALGLMVALLGLPVSSLSLTALLLFILAHALYKACLFMSAGVIEHQCDTRDLSELSGVASRLPLTATALLLALVSSLGLPPFLGFFAKEYMFKASFSEQPLLAFALGLVVAASMLGGAVMLRLASVAFAGRSLAVARAEEGKPAMVVPALILMATGLVFGLVVPLLQPFLQAGVTAMAPAIIATVVIWPAINDPALQLSAVSLLVAILLFLLQRHFFKTDIQANHGYWTAEQMFNRLLAGIEGLALLVRNALLRGSLHDHLLLIMALLTMTMLLPILFFPTLEIKPVGQIYWFEVALALTMLLGLILAIRARGALAMLVALGIVGYGLGLLFIMRRAPDVAYTQFLVETLTLVVLALVLLRLPRQSLLLRRLDKQWRDALLSILLGVSVFIALAGLTSLPFSAHITDYFAQHSYISAHGRNIVNVIIVDFRAFDTLGEITVLAAAGLLAAALLPRLLGKTLYGGR